MRTKARTEIPPNRLEFVPYADGRIVLLRLTGEYDVFWREELREAIGFWLGTGKTVIVDLSDATLIDSAVLQAILVSDRLARKSGQRLIVRLGKTPVVRRVIELTGLDRVLHCVDSFAEAIRAAQESPAIFATR
jgi:anti-sigma B factor antagonist